MEHTETTKENEQKSGLEQTYTQHHTKGKRRGRTMFGEVRGEFLRKEIGTDKNILDIGCRDGELTKEFVTGNTVLGLDIDMQALSVAKENLGIEIQKADLHGDWGVQKNHYDVVVAGEVMEHLYYPDTVLGKVVDVLNDDGFLIGSVPNGFSLKNRLRLLFGIKKGTTLHDPTHINHFKHSELKQKLETYFEDVSIVPLGRFAWLDRFMPGMFSFMLLFVARKKKNV